MKAVRNRSRNDASINVRLPNELRNALVDLAERERRSIGAVVRLAAEQYVAKKGRISREWLPDLSVRGK